MARTFFRIVKSDPPGALDFASREQLGLALLDPSAEARDLWQGVSVFASLSQAFKKARTFPALGAFIAILEIDDDRDVVTKRTGSQRGHHTIWATVDQLQERVVAVIAVESIRLEPERRDEP